MILLIFVAASYSLVTSKPSCLSTTTESDTTDTPEELLVNWKDTLKERDMWAKQRTVCKDKYGLNTQVLLNFESRKDMTKTPELAKFVNCIYKAIGAMDENNKFHVCVMQDMLTDDYYHKLESCVPKDQTGAPEDTSFEFYYCAVNQVG